MRELVVSEAPAARVSAIAKRVVEDEGGVVSEHTHQATRFDNLRVDDDAWSRSGYVGTYQRFQDKEVRVRVRLWAAWPRRLFLLFAIAGLVQAILYFGVSFGGGSLSPNVWIFSAFVTFLGLGVALLTYATSWAASADAEEAMALGIGRGVSSDPEVPGKVYAVGDWTEHRRDLVENAVANAPAPKPREATEVSGSEEKKASRRLGRVRRKAEERTPEAAPVETAPAEEKGSRFRFGRRKKEETPEAPEDTASSEGSGPPAAETGESGAKPKRRFMLRRKKGEDADTATEGSGPEG